MTLLARPTLRLRLTARRLGGLAVLLLAASLSVGAKSPGGGATGYYATSLGRAGMEVVIVQYWSKGPLFRSETIVSGHPIVTLVTKDQYYTWDALTGDGYVVGRSPSAMARDAKRERPFGTELEELLSEGGEKIRSETLNGVRVDVYRVTDSDGRRTLWVDAERSNLPFRLESYDRKTGRTGTLDWINWLRGVEIPDRFFEPPTDIELVRFETYEDFVDALRKGPVGPTPPLFHYLLHHRGGQ